MAEGSSGVPRPAPPPDRREVLLARSRALEEACDFVGAATVARDAGALAHAAHLASLAGDGTLVAELVDAIAEGGAAEAIRAGEDLLARGHAAVAGELFLRGEAFARAGEAFAAASRPIPSAEAFERAGKPGDGARVLDAALRADPGHHVARLALAELLARHGRLEGAVRALQALAVGSPERLRGLPLLARSLRALGLGDAAAEVEVEMKSLGVTASAPVSAAADAAPARGVVLFGRFEIVREVAFTPHARLVEAFDRVGQRAVAVKLFAPSQAATGRDALVRFEREARALAQLRHPSIVPLVAYLPEGPAMALEWMSGGSLADLMTREPIAPARAIEITAALLGALGVAHRLGILHRDVKPSNVLFDAIGSPRLSDFGAAHLGDGQNTATAGAIGTFAYMSPEQRLGRPATVRSDVYAAGALLYEMITGEAAEPLEDPSFDELPPSAFHPDLGPAHDAAIAALLQRDPARRPLDAFEARKALEALAWPRDVVARPGPASSRGRISVPPPSRPERVGPAQREHDGRDGERVVHDTWTGRDVLLVPMSQAELARARVFAQAAHAALPAILRASTAEAAIWVELPPGRALADRGGPLTREQVAAVAEAVAELHALGGAHGALDAEHVYVDGDRVAVAYPRVAPEADARDRDQVALAVLASRTATS